MMVIVAHSQVTRSARIPLFFCTLLLFPTSFIQYLKSAVRNCTLKTVNYCHGLAHHAHRTNLEHVWVFRKLGVDVKENRHVYL